MLKASRYGDNLNVNRNNDDNLNGESIEIINTSSIIVE